MDVVTVETMIQSYKESRELEDKDPVLLMFKQWPQSKKYQDNFGKLPGLEQKVCFKLCVDQWTINIFFNVNQADNLYQQITVYQGNY